MSDKHNFFRQRVGTLTKVYEQPEAEEIMYRLIDAYLGKSRLEFWDITHSDDDPLSQSILSTFDEAVDRILNHEPVQYVVGHSYFLNLRLKVSPAVLIPRQETEELVNEIIQQESNGTNLRALDIGTGSGCIPIALAKEIKGLEIYAYDISKEALKIASDNAKAHSALVQFSLCDILKDSITLEDLDFIVSNPPYVLESDKKLMRKNVLEHEPGLALFVPDDEPLLFYRIIARKALAALKKGGRLYLEIHENFGKEIKSMLESMGYLDVSIKKDFFLEKDRMILAKRG